MESKKVKQKSFQTKPAKQSASVPFFLKKDNRKTRREGLERKRPLDSHETEKKKVTNENKEGETTSWGGVSSWYDAHLGGEKKTYHDTIVYPNVMRRCGDVKGKTILDLACGQGIFSHRFAKQGAKVIGVDIGKELIDIAKKQNEDAHNPDFFVSPSHDLFMITNKSVDIVLISLAIQNIEKMQETLAECGRVLKKGGKLLIVMNHPAFRIPGESRWDYDEHESVQYRRLDSYLSESKVKIDMTPGSKVDKKFTISFHRPLQVYSKALEKSGFLIQRLEEWESDRESEKGPRQKAENKARKEIPLFLSIEAVQWSHD